MEIRFLKSLLLLTIISLISFALVGFSLNQLAKSIYTRAIERSLTRNNNTEHYERAIKPVEYAAGNVMSSYFLGGYEYEIVGNGYNWLSYWRGTKRDFNLSLVHYEISSYYRPTWSNTYVQLARFARFQDDFSAYEKYLRLAYKFAPHDVATQLISIDAAFSDWLNQSRLEKVAASKHLIILTKNWRYRTELNKMIFYSPGKQRICNMLAFNKLKFDACL